MLSLYAKIRQLLYCPDGLKIPSMETFKFVMEHFYWFEKEVGINVYLHSNAYLHKPQSRDMSYIQV